MIVRSRDQKSAHRGFGRGALYLGGGACLLLVRSFFKLHGLCPFLPPGFACTPVTGSRVMRGCSAEQRADRRRATRACLRPATLAPEVPHWIRMAPVAAAVSLANPRGFTSACSFSLTASIGPWSAEANYLSGWPHGTKPGTKPECECEVL